MHKVEKDLLTLDFGKFEKNPFQLRSEEATRISIVISLMLASLKNDRLEKK